MSVEINVTVTAKNPPSMDFSIEMPVPCPTEPTAQMEWSERLERRVQEKLSEIDSYGSGYDGYIVEFINEYAGGWTLDVHPTTAMWVPPSTEPNARKLLGEGREVETQNGWTLFLVPDNLVPEIAKMGGRESGTMNR